MKRCQKYFRWILVLSFVVGLSVLPGASLSRSVAYAHPAGNCHGYTDVGSHYYICQPLDDLSNAQSSQTGEYAIGGYSNGCTTGAPCFKPYEAVTRQQFAKMLAIAMNWGYYASTRHFADVATTSPFFLYIEAIYNRATGYPEYERVISGYQCGTRPEEPCDAQNRPYFRPGENITRQQMSKMISNASNFLDDVSSRQPTYADVPTSSPFFKYIERLTMAGKNPPYPPELAPQPYCQPTSPQKPCYYPGSRATRIETAHFAWLARVGLNPYAQVFPHRYNEQGAQGWDGITAYVSTPDPGLVGNFPSYWVAAPVGLTNYWSGHYVEVGPAKDCLDAADPSTCRRYPYSSWNAGSTHYENNLWNTALAVGSGYTFRVESAGSGAFRTYWCSSSGCNQIYTTGSMGTNSLPFWVAGGETPAREQHWGNIYIYDVSAHRYGGSWTTGSDSCYDPKLVPIQVGYGTRSMPCTNGSWVVNY